MYNQKWIQSNSIIYNQVIIGMIVSQLPSLEEIYDFSSKDLQKIVEEINLKFKNTVISQEQQQIYHQYIENINIELEQRKTLEFFQQLCSVDNPYLKKVTDFNNQFLKLASDAIAAQAENQENQSQPFKKKHLQNIKQDQQQKQWETEQNDHRSISSAIVNSSKLSSIRSHKLNSKATDQKAYTMISQKKSQDGNSKKMGIGRPSKKDKNNMKDFVMSILSKNNADCYVVKKAGNAPNKPQPNFTVNQRGHLVNANTLDPIIPLSTKNIKSSSVVKEKPNQTVSSSKNIIDSNRANEKQLQKKRSQAMQKVKNIKPEKKRQKPLNNKQLVEMIREEQKQKEKQKEIKDKKKELQKYCSTKSTNQGQKQNKQSEITIEAKRQKQEFCRDNELKGQMKKDPINQKVEEIRQIIVVQQETTKQVSINMKHDQIKQQIRQEQNTRQKQINHVQNQQNVLFTTKKICKQPQEQSNQHKKIQIQQNSKVSQKIIIKQTNQVDNEKIQTKTSITDKRLNREIQPFHKQSINFPKQVNGQDDNIQQQYEKQMKQLIKLKKEIQQQKPIHVQQQKQSISQTKTIKNSSKQQIFGKIVDIQQPSQQIKQNSQKKCYNQQYWIHIRQQAEDQIKRFKQEKQIGQITKKLVKNNILKSISQNVQNSILDDEIAKENTIIAQEENTTQQNSQKQSKINEQDQFFDKKRKELKKMIVDHNKRRTVNKKPPLPIYNPAKTLYVLPTFNYLQIYPTFNHIFSVMYTKAQHQALMDIPLIMKDLTNMFSTHLQHFKEKSGYFQPAIFLPFDSANNIHLNDPRQLLLHAQSTYVNLKKIVERLQIFNQNLHGQYNSTDTRYYRVVKTKEQVYDIISTGFLRRKGWKQLPHGCSLRSSWNLFWSWAKPDIDVSKLLVWQKINHFPFNKNLSRKDLLYKNLDSFRKMLKISFNFLPLTYNLPKQFTQFSIKFHEEEMINRNMNYWIMKPIGKSRGRGIKVINNLAQLNYTDNIVVQKYITNPLLLDGYKFDMRIYVLVTNFHPLEAFVYKQGFARLSTEKFSLQPMFIKNIFVHLTNFAVNKNNEEAKQSAAFSGGSKISLKVLKDKLAKMNYSFANIWSQVHQIIIKSLLGCSISVPSFPTAFQLFGYDIMIDTDSNCHLIEINASPSLERTYLIDEIVKQSLIDDILDIVDPPQFDKEQLLDIMAQRLIGKKKITPQEDLIAIARILKYKKIRKFGEIPQNMGLFQMIAPSKLSTDLEKLIKGRSGANNPRNID